MCVSGYTRYESLEGIIPSRSGVFSCSLSTPLGRRARDPLCAKESSHCMMASLLSHGLHPFAIARSSSPRSSLLLSPPTAPLTWVRHCGETDLPSSTTFSGGHIWSLESLSSSCLSGQSFHSFENLALYISPLVWGEVLGKSPRVWLGGSWRSPQVEPRSGWSNLGMEASVLL